MQFRNRGEESPHVKRTVLAFIAGISELDLDHLRAKWTELFATAPPKYNRNVMLKRMIWKVQEMYYGGLPQMFKDVLAAEKAKEPLLGEITLPKKSKRHTLPGTRYVRIWRGKKYEVLETENGFEYDGVPYRSLSGAARAITGTNWNGRAFFGVNNAKKDKKTNKR